MDSDCIIVLIGEMTVENPQWRIWASRDHMNDTIRYHGRVDLVIHGDTPGEIQDQVRRLNRRTIGSLAEDIIPD